VRVLVVDDSATARFVLQRAIEALGHEAIAVDDGLVAWERYQADPVEVVVSDWVMPGMSGEELCVRIRSVQDAPYTYFVLLTSLEDRAHALRGMDAGADDYLTKPLDPHELEMRLVAASRVTALHRRIAAQQRELQREVALAARIQRGLMPQRPPDVPGVSVAGRWVPAAHVGGDFYDHIIDDRGRLVVYIADVAGHSVGAALLGAMARSVVRREITAHVSPAAVLRAANGAMFADLATAELFITMFCARYDAVSGDLDYANAGHNPPLLHRAGGGVESLDADGAALGILEDLEFEERHAALSRGDLVLLYTDGVVEAAAPDGQVFGEQRLERLVAGRDGAGAAGVLEALYGAVRRHAGGAPQQDDITMLALEDRRAA
jgi:serine phosphatase RsbU (regulator of sigma subunit)